MTPRHALLPLALLLAWSSSALAERGFQVRDLATLDRYSSPTLSHDGRKLVFAKRVVDYDANKATSGLWIEDLGWNSALAVIFLFAPHFGHLFLIGRHPNCSAWFVFDVRRKFRTQLLPELLRVAGESKLGFGVVHDDDVAHAGSGGAASNHIAVDDCHPHALAGALFRASRAYDARSNHHYVIDERRHC